MKTVLAPVIGVLVIALLVLGITATQAQPAPVQQAQMFPTLEGVPPEQWFDHFMGAEIHMTDQNGNPVTYVLTPGVVSAVDSNSITIVPHGQTDPRTFMITSNTNVHAMPSPGSVQAITNGDHVVITTYENSNDALMIFEPGQGGMRGFHPMFR